MNARILKETRALLPVLLTTAAITLVAWVIATANYAEAISSILFCIGATLMAAVCFGGEFSSRTVGLLLSQPVPRKKIWNEKMLVLGAGLVLAFGAWLLGFTFQKGHEPDAQVMAFLAVGIFSSTAWFSLRAGNTLIGAIIAWLVPCGIIGAVQVLLLLVQYYSLNTVLFNPVHNYFIAHPVTADNPLNHVIRFFYYLNPLVYLWAAGIPYFAFAYWRGYVAWKNLQAVEMRQREIALPEGWQGAVGGSIGKFLPGYTSPTASLVRKELQLQRPVFIVAAALSLLAGCDMIIGHFHRSDIQTGILVMAIVLCAGVLPCVVTGISVAEERSLGIAGWHRTLPPSITRQWWTKLAVVAGTCVFLGVLVPYGMERIGEVLNAVPWDHSKSSSAANSPILWSGVRSAILGYAFFLVLGIFSSSVSANTFRSILLTLALMATGAAVFGLSTYYITRLADDLRLDSGRGNASEAADAGGVILAIVLILIYCLARRNYGRGEPSTQSAWLQSGFVLGVIAIGSVAICLWTL